MSTDQDEEEARWSRYMAAAHRGDARLYEALLDELGGAIERFVRRRFGVLGVFTEDCVQECLLAVHLGRHTYDPQRPFRPWLFAIVRHKTIDLLRRSYRAPRVELSVAELALARGHDSDPREELEAGELWSQLDPIDRSALALTKLQGFSTAEAAGKLGISETAMRTRVSRALRATVDLLRKEQYK